MGLLSRIKTWTSEVLTASDLNAEFDNILNNLTPTYVDDASANATAMQTTADPYPGGVESLATTLAGELQRLRYLIKQITGEANWYIDPDRSIATITAGDGLVMRANPGTMDFDKDDLTTDSLWHDLDLSAIVPSGASAVILYVYIDDDAAASSINFRKNGDAASYALFSVITQVANIVNRVQGVIACDANRVIEYQTSHVTFTTIYITVVGWYI